jgi:hypothetical protein
VTSGTSFGSNAGQHEWRAEARRARRRHAQGRLGPLQRIEAPAQILEHLLGHAGADAAGINEPAVVRVVAKQKRAEVRARSFRIGPADDYEFLPVKAFGFAPEAAIAGCIGRSAAFDTMPSKPSLQAWLRMSSPSPVS